MRRILCNVLPCDVTFRAFSDMSALGAVTHAAVAGGICGSAGDFLADFDYGESVAAEGAGSASAIRATVRRVQALGRSGCG